MTTTKLRKQGSSIVVTIPSSEAKNLNLNTEYWVRTDEHGYTSLISKLDNPFKNTKPGEFYEERLWEGTKKECSDFVYPLYKKAEEVIRQAGLFNDLRKKISFEKDVSVENDLFHWHLNSIDVNDSNLLILTHDVSGTATAIYLKEAVTLNQFDLFLPAVVENLFLRAGCSSQFIKEYLNRSERLVFSSVRDRKYLSKNTVAGKYIKEQGIELELDRMLQSHLTVSYNTMPKKSLAYQTPNEVLYSKSKEWICCIQRSSRRPDLL